MLVWHLHQIHSDGLLVKYFIDFLSYLNIKTSTFVIIASLTSLAVYFCPNNITPLHIYYPDFFSLDSFACIGTAKHLQLPSCLAVLAGI